MQLMNICSRWRLRVEAFGPLLGFYDFWEELNLYRPHMLWPQDIFMRILASLYGTIESSFNHGFSENSSLCYHFSWWNSKVLQTSFQTKCQVMHFSRQMLSYIHSKWAGCFLYISALHKFIVYCFHWISKSKQMQKNIFEYSRTKIVEPTVIWAYYLF